MRIASECELRRLFPSRLVYWRRRRGLTQIELGVLVGLHQVSISRIEGGKQLPNRRGMERFAEALGVSLETLLKSEPSDRENQAPAKVKLQVLM